MLSIVVSWRNRHQLRQALPSLVAAAERADGDITIVDYGGNSPQLYEQLQDIPVNGIIRVARVNGENFFNKARAQNIGAANSSQPVLFFCDCDIIVQPDEIAMLANEVRMRPGIFATLAGVKESVPNSRQAGNLVRFGYELNLRLANGRSLRIVDDEEDAATGSRHAPGLLLVRREDFHLINGYNGRLHGWGWEDQDMVARLTLSAGLRRELRGEATHISHGDDERMAHYPSIVNRWESRDRMFRQALSLYDADDFQGTFEQDRAHLHHVLKSQL